MPTVVAFNSDSPHPAAMCSVHLYVYIFNIHCPYHWSACISQSTCHICSISIFSSLEVSPFQKIYRYIYILIIHRER